MIRIRGEESRPSPSFPLTSGCNFLVEIDGLEEDGTGVVGGFRDVSGLISRSEVIEYRVGNQSAPLKIPGRPIYGNVRLSRGVTSSAALYLWRRRVEEGEEDLRNGSIVLLDAAMREKGRWNFYGAWPCRYEGPRLDSASEELSIENLELVVEKLERVRIEEAGE